MNTYNDTFVEHIVRRKRGGTELLIFARSVLLGVIENLSKGYISSQLSDAIVFAVLILVLLIKPTGIMGKKITEKV